jgi:hypothetical protein
MVARGFVPSRSAAAASRCPALVARFLALGKLASCTMPVVSRLAALSTQLAAPSNVHLAAAEGSALKVSVNTDKVRARNTLYTLILHEVAPPPLGAASVWQNEADCCAPAWRALQIETAGFSLPTSIWYRCCSLCCSRAQYICPRHHSHGRTLTFIVASLITVSRTGGRHRGGETRGRQCRTLARTPCDKPRLGTTGDQRRRRGSLWRPAYHQRYR